VSAKSYLGGKVIVHGGDCLDVLRGMESYSVDSCVTDPPYALVSIAKRFGADSAAPPKDYGGSGVYQRASAGFMGKQWDTGDRAFTVELWAEVFRVLKPGAHVLAFAGTRTYHRLACAIEDAAFEIRDQVGWAYGSGFPKSRNVSKDIDKRPGVSRYPEFAADLRAAMKAKGYTNTFDVAEKVVGRRTGAVANWQKYQFPEAKWWPALRDLLDMDGAKWGPIIAEAEREIVGQQQQGKLAVAPGQDNDRSAITLDITAPSTAAGREWQGWGTALKPAWEPIVLARKPLSEGTVAANVLKHGTGAINVDGCRVDSDGTHGSANSAGQGAGRATANPEPHALGRWPANLIHDGSDEVVAAFPETATGFRPKQSTANPNDNGRVIYGKGLGHQGVKPFNDAGSAARFFYSSKADADDRLGSKHPTIKPVDLIQYLVRLITPPNGICLDPFAGTGTTGEAAFREDMRAVLIEREVEYLQDIERRMALVLGGAVERRNASIKAKGHLQTANDLPLFGGGA
jgi:DNA modification methylase